MIFISDRRLPESWESMNLLTLGAILSLASLLASSFSRLKTLAVAPFGIVGGALYEWNEGSQAQSSEVLLILQHHLSSFSFALMALCTCCMVSLLGLLPQESSTMQLRDRTMELWVIGLKVASVGIVASVAVYEIHSVWQIRRGMVAEGLNYSGHYDFGDVGASFLAGLIGWQAASYLSRRHFAS